MDHMRVVSRLLFSFAMGFAVVAVPARAADLKVIVPAAPGGGYDQLGRAVQQSLQSAKLADRVQVLNAAGAGGTIGLAQLINNNKGDGSTLMVTGKGMMSAVYINKSPVTLTSATPIARLTGEYQVLVVPAASPLKTMADLVTSYKTNPAAVSWGGGLAGGVDQLTAGMIVQAIGSEVGKFNYVAFNSGGEVAAQVLGSHITVGLGGYNEFAPQIAAGKMRALGITADKRLPNVAIPTLKEQGVNVEFINWRGVMAPPGISEAQRQELVRTMTRLSASDGWKALVKKNDWVDLFIAGDEFKAYVETEQKNVLALVTTLGLVKK